MPIESTQHLYNLLGPQSWEEMRPYANEKFIPAPLTLYSANRLTAIGLVWIIHGFLQNVKEQRVEMRISRIILELQIDFRVGACLLQLLCWPPATFT